MTRVDPNRINTNGETGPAVAPAQPIQKPEPDETPRPVFIPEEVPSGHVKLAGTTAATVAVHRSPILKELQFLVEDSELRPGAERTAQAEVDIDFGEGKPHVAEVNVTKLRAAMAGDDLEFQQRVERALGALVAEGALTQERSARLFDPPLNAKGRDLRLVLDDLKAYVGAAAPKAPPTGIFGLGSLRELVQSASGQNARAGIDAPPLVLKKRWENFARTQALKQEADVNALVQWVLRQSYQETTQDLYMYAEKVKFFNACKKAIREELKAARKALATLAGKADNAHLIPPFPKTEIVTQYAGGQFVTKDSETAKAAVEKLTAAVKEYEKAKNKLAQERRDVRAAKKAKKKAKRSYPRFSSYRGRMVASGGGDGSTVTKDSETARVAVAKLAATVKADQEAKIRLLTEQAEGEPAKITPKAKSNGLKLTETSSAWHDAGDDGNYSGCSSSNDASDDNSSGGGHEISARQMTPEEKKAAIEAYKQRYKQAKAHYAQQKRELAAAQAVFNQANAVYQKAKKAAAPYCCSTKAELETHIKTMEEKLSSVGDDAQLANVDLQNMLQKQQQTLQMMSNISKMLHDTALAVIRKIS